ncbi:MAG: MOSC domain-containing protein [Acidobacteriota bacterium]
MIRDVGTIKGIYRYPVKSMQGESLQSAALGWHGIPGDRRFAFRRLDDAGGFPWLYAGRFPGLLRYKPLTREVDGEPVATHVVTPSGAALELDSEELRQELSAAFKGDVSVFRLKHGMFDEAMLSLINLATIDEIGRRSGNDLDPRRFRPNILVEATSSEPFQEDAWIGKAIAFGRGSDTPAMTSMLRDERCSMINFDPETAASSPEILKAAVKANTNCAGLYGATLRTGTISVGDVVSVIDI